MACNGPIWITPEISVKTCTDYSWWNYHDSWSYRARVTVHNNAWYSVSVRPDLLAGGVTYVGNTVNVASGTELEAFGNDVRQLNIASQGRGYIQALNWSTYTYAP
jgi:hypothetical protein